MQPNIEPGIAPVCAVLNSLAGVSTRWSCEGHPALSFRPYAVFTAPQPLALEIHRLLEAGHQTGQLQYNWHLTANFTDDGLLQYMIEPNDVRMRRRWWWPRWSRNAMNAELLVLTGLLKTMLAARHLC